MQNDALQICISGLSSPFRQKVNLFLRFIIKCGNNAIKIDISLICTNLISYLQCNKYIKRKVKNENLLDLTNNLCVAETCSDFSIPNPASSRILWRHDVERHTLSLNFPKKKFQCSISIEDLSWFF